MGQLMQNDIEKHTGYHDEQAKESSRDPLLRRMEVSERNEQMADHRHHGAYQQRGQIDHRRSFFIVLQINVQNLPTGFG